MPLPATPAAAALQRLRLPWGRRAHVLASAAVVLAILGLNVVLHLLPVTGLAVSVTAAAALLVFARLTGLTWAQLGLSRRHLRSGLSWGAGVVAIIGAGYLVAVLVPETRAAFLDARYHFGVPQALFTAFLVIPLGTIVLEEVAFRSVLWGMLSRHMGTWRVLAMSSTLFGLWHVVPSLSFASANQAFSALLPVTGVAATAAAVVGTVLFTGLGGVVAGELRRRSGSVLASASMHWATNSLGVLFGVVAWRLAG